MGAGSGASVGKLFGMHRAMKGGIGNASVRVGPWVVGALVACNAVGDVLDPATGQVIAGARTADGQSLLDTQAALLNGERSTRPMPGTNTTIGVVATNATLNKAQAQRLAISAHDGLARSIRPAHTTLDGDTLRVTVGREWLDVRLVDVDCPETRRGTKCRAGGDCEGELVRGARVGSAAAPQRAGARRQRARRADKAVVDGAREAGEGSG